MVTTSTAANSQVIKRGIKTGQQKILLDILQKCPSGLINGELADRSGLGREQVFRRMPELEKSGCVERHYKGDGQVVNRVYRGYAQQVWFPVKEEKNV